MFGQPLHIANDREKERGVLTICFDVSHVQRGRAGLGNATLRYLESVLLADQSNRYLLHGWSHGIDRDRIAGFRDPRVSLRVNAVPGFVKRIYWNTLRVPPIEAFVGEVDLVHSLDPFLPPMRARGAVVTVHDLCSFRFPMLFEPRVVRWSRAIPLAVRKAGAVLVPSTQTLRDVTEILKVPEEVVHRIPIPPAMDFHIGQGEDADESVKKRFGLDAPFLLSVGTLEPRKNLVRLVKAYDLCVSRSALDIDLVIAGKLGWDYREILSAIKSSPASGRIHYLGYIPDMQLASLYRLAELMIYPSLFEGYGMPIVEAMACGTPVITSNVSSMKELGEGAAELVDPADTDALAQTIAALLADNERRSQLSQKGLVKVGAITRAATGKMILDAYASALSNR